MCSGRNFPRLELPDNRDVDDAVVPEDSAPAASRGSRESYRDLQILPSVSMQAAGDAI
jgi:hypothetical protein